MATKIRLRRAGRRKQASFRIVVSGGTHARDGRFTEQIGKYNPRTDPAFIQIDEGRALYWLQRGAEASDTVRSIFRRAGILEKLAKGAEPEGVVTIGDVGGKTVFPTAGPARESPTPTAETAAGAAPAEAEAKQEGEEGEAAEAAPVEEAGAAAAEAPTAEADTVTEAEEEAEEEEEAKKATAEAEAESDDEEEDEAGEPQAAAEAGTDDDASAEEEEEEEK